MTKELQIKQYVAVVKNGWGTRFAVFMTGDPKYYLFAQMIGDTSIFSGLSFPVLKKNLRKDICSALAHGWGNSLSASSG